MPPRSQQLSDLPEHGFAIRDAVQADVSRLTDIAVAAKAYWGYPPAWLAQWQASLTITCSDLDRWTIRVASGADGTPVGFSAIVESQPRWGVEHLWVDPATVRKGVGRLLLRDALARATARGAVGLSIDADPHAAGFYRRCGAAASGTIPAPMPGSADRVLYRFRLDDAATTMSSRGPGA